MRELLSAVLVLPLLGITVILHGCDSCGDDDKKATVKCMNETYATGSDGEGTLMVSKACEVMTDLVKCVPADCCSEPGDEDEDNGKKPLLKDELAKLAEKYKGEPYNCKDIPDCGS
eukprot:gnl/TRDRNA2_/TRDRNA2_80130_c0_seq2.p3 gnl/TRDRNA2_/TRDRNA2_80130_c0~~gnl/TRDRNA2_/TRDRNA2_80130_c0_seq2.p3  ORF type:complete len:116 (+),score=28.12 gnl/TRDRNA2_/TRDRNA2_80130_c0_seq2:190-537(+)